MDLLTQVKLIMRLLMQHSFSIKTAPIWVWISLACESNLLIQIMQMLAWMQIRMFSKCWSGMILSSVSEFKLYLLWNLLLSFNNNFIFIILSLLTACWKSDKYLWNNVSWSGDSTRDAWRNSWDYRSWVPHTIYGICPRTTFLDTRSQWTLFLTES